MKKAKEYVEEIIQLQDKISAEQIGFNLLKQLAKEVEDIIVIRKIQRSESMMSVIQEQNRKWNAIENGLEKRGTRGTRLLKQNGFMDYFTKMTADAETN